MEFAEFVHTVKRYRWVLLAAAAITTLGLVVNGLLQPSSYRSTALVQIPGTVDGDGIWRDYDLAYSERVAQTYINLAQSTPIRSQIQGDLGLDELPSIEVELLPTTELVLITVDGPDPESTVLVADEMSKVFRDRSWERAGTIGTTVQAGNELSELLTELEAERTSLVSRIARIPELDEGRTDPALPGLQAELASLNNRIGNIQSRVDNFETASSLLDGPITIIEEASRPATESSPSIPLLAFLGLVLGTVGGIVLILIRRATDSSIRSADDAHWATGLPVIGELRNGTGLPDNNNLIDRIAASQYLTREPSDPGRVLLITTPSEVPEPSLLGLRLVEVYQRLGIDAYLFDCDRRSDEAGGFLDSDGRNLLADFALLRKEYDVTVVNAPGYLTSPRIPLFRLVADETIVIANLDETDRGELREIAEELGEQGRGQTSLLVASDPPRPIEFRVPSLGG